MVTRTSADAPPLTRVLAVLLLFSSFGSKVALVTVAILVKKVPGAVPVGMCSVSAKFALLPAVKFATVQVTVPVPPGAGVLHVQPAGDDSETNVIPGGIGSDTDTDVASSGPPLKTFSVYETLLFAAAVAGPDLAMLRSASCADAPVDAQRKSAHATVAGNTAVSHFRD